MEQTRQKESKPPRETMNQDSIEELLAQAAQSMDQLESQLGSDGDEPAAAEAVAPEALDSTLAQVEKELEGLHSQIAAEESSVKRNAIPAAPAATQTDNDSAAQADDILSSLAMELESLNKNLSDPGEPQAAAPVAAVSVSPDPAADESIDDLLNQFSQVADDVAVNGAGETADADESLEALLGQADQTPGNAVQVQPDPVAESPSADNPVDDLLNGMAETPSAAFQPGSQSAVEDALSELNRLSQAAESTVAAEPDDALIDALANPPAPAETAAAPLESPVAAQPAPPETNFVDDDLFGGRAKKKAGTPAEPVPDQAISDDDQLVMAELEQASQGGGAAASVAKAEPEEAGEQAGPDETYAQFTAPQRAVLKTLDAVNRPFQVVPSQANDTLGMVAVVTLMISMVATALFLLYR